MTTNSGTDPANRWATEHYGFEDNGTDQGAATVEPSSPRTPPSAPSTSATPDAPRRRRRGPLVAAGVLVASLLAGFGGVAVAAGVSGDGVVGDRGDGRHFIVQLDGDNGRGGDRGGDVGGDIGGTIGDGANGFGQP